MVKIEIDLSKLERGTHVGRVKVTRGGKTFWRKQRVGVKGGEKSVKTTKPNPEVMSAIQDSHDKMIEYRVGHDTGFVKVDSEKGTFTWQNQSYIEWNTNKRIKPDPVDFRVESNTIVRVDDNSQVTIPSREIEATKSHYGRESSKWFSYLDDKWGSSLKKVYNEFEDNLGEYNERLNALDIFVPKYEAEVGEGSSKYSGKMGLQNCTNAECNIDRFIPNLWYDGISDNTAMVGEAVQEVVSGRYNKNNVIQQQMPLMIEGARKINKEYGGDTIYRGETNVKSVKDLLLQLDEFGDADLDDKLFSCTENEKLGKWYASVHNQESARGVASKTYVMLKIPREKFEDNVIMDYRLTGTGVRPEQEVTIVGNDINLTGNDIMVNANTPKRKTKKWMTFTQFKSEGGETQNLIDQMVGEK
jgi:hypothetical protein